MNNFKELIVWQKAVDFVVKIYEVTNCFPDSERYNLVSQMQRAGTSIPSNISEGAGRNSVAVFKNHLTIALGTSYELETQIIIGRKLNFIGEERHKELIKDLNEIQRMTLGLYNSL